MPAKIKVVGGKFNNIEGNLRVVDRSRHETNFDCHNVYGNTLTDAFNTNSEKSDGQRREDYAGPPPSQQPHQNSPAGGRIENRDSFNMKNTQMSNAFNDNSETHYFGRVPPTNQGQGVRPQNPQSKDQTPNQPQQVESIVLPRLQHLEQKMRQTFSNPEGQPRSLSEVNVVPNLHRNNGDDEFDGNNEPPPVSTSSSGPTVRTIKGNYTKYDNSDHTTNISSHNVKGNTVINSFNDKSKEGTNNK